MSFTTTIELGKKNDGALYRKASSCDLRRRYSRDPMGLNKENRIYIKVELRKSLGISFLSPFQPEREFKSVQIM